MDELNPDYALHELPDYYPAAEALFSALSGCPGRVWLDSSRHAAETGQWSIMVACPYARMEGRGNTLCTADSSGGRHSWESGDTAADIQVFLEQHKLASAAPPPLGIPFAGGVVGFIGYEAGRSFDCAVPKAEPSIDLPDFALLAYDAAVVFSHQLKKAWGIACSIRRPSADALQALIKLLPMPVSSLKPVSFPKPDSSVALTNFSRNSFCEAVSRAREYIAAGDIYQVNLAQRFHCLRPPAADTTYLRLRRLNPAPYGAFLDFGSFQILSSSPERFLRKQGNWLNTRPIKGTRPRGETRRQDTLLREALLASEKERAELLMITDLERNDLGRICGYGSVCVDELYKLESYATVHHLIASISGKIRPAVGTAELLRATFPGGSITGAPKIRAMQIIEELETVPRHVFTGSIGYFAAHGDIDLNIAIRTIVRTDGWAHFHVGAGIVWDSDPSSEYDETLAKGKALFATLGMTLQE